RGSHLPPRPARPTRGVGPVGRPAGHDRAGAARRSGGSRPMAVLVGAVVDVAAGGAVAADRGGSDELGAPQRPAAAGGAAGAWGRADTAVGVRAVGDQAAGAGAGGADHPGRPDLPPVGDRGSGPWRTGAGAARVAGPARDDFDRFGGADAGGGA